ncbi:MAG: arginase family protein [Thermoflavifilum sp.]|nr:arginase family protein [Thermoflavifilum sp.]
MPVLSSTVSSHQFSKDNIFGLPFDEETAQLIVLPVPWEVTLPHHPGTARSPEHILKVSKRVHVNLIDEYNGWKRGIAMQSIDKRLLMRSDYLRKEAELYINFLMDGGNLAENSFIQKSLRDVNQGCQEMNTWVYEQTQQLLNKGKNVVVLGGDHSVAWGYIKALSEQEKAFGILQIDAHCDLRETYVGFTHSHGSVMRKVLDQIPQAVHLVQLGARDFIEEEWLYLNEQPDRITTFFYKQIAEMMYRGATWENVCDQIIARLPERVYLSFDIDGLDPKLCRHTARPVPGGFEVEQVFFLLKKLIQSGRKLIGFDLTEIGNGLEELDARVGAHILFRLCNLLLANLYPETS